MSNYTHKTSLVAELHSAVKDAPSGLTAKTIASLLGKPYQTLMCELSRQEGHKLGADFVLPILLLSGSDEPLKFLARQMEGVFIRLPKSDVQSYDLMATLADSIREFGEFASEAANDIADGNIPLDQLCRIEKEGDEAIEKIMAMKKVARAIYEKQYGKNEHK